MEKLEVTKAEKNRTIAGWIEPMPFESVNMRHGEWIPYDKSVGGAWSGEWDEDKKLFVWQPVNFYTSEAASGKALDKMGFYLGSLKMDWYHDKLIRVSGYTTRELISAISSDRKTAIAEAAYQVAMKEKEKA